MNVIKSLGLSLLFVLPEDYRHTGCLVLVLATSHSVCRYVSSCGPDVVITSGLSSCWACLVVLKSSLHQVYRHVACVSLWS